MNKTDYIVATSVMGVLTVLLLLAGVLYWNLHGGAIEDFAFWSEGDWKWAEVLFWSFFTATAWTAATVGVNMYGQKAFRFDWAWWSFGRILEAPLVSLALVFVLTNLGVAFGDVTLSLKDAPMTVVIALAIVGTYFSDDAVEALKSVAGWFKKQVSSALDTESGSPVPPPKQEKAKTAAKGSEAGR